jgi:hypothetical protein
VLKGLKYFALLVLAVAVASAGTVFIQPIQVCDNGGMNCANSAKTLFAAEGNKIWAQADISLVFLPWTEFDSATYQNLEGGGQKTLSDLVAASGNGANPNALVLNFWFVSNVFNSYGEAFLGANGTAIADNTFSFNGGLGRIDTIFHELGHNLGLIHYDTLVGDGGCALTSTKNHLMANGGSCRNVPGTIGDITPSGSLMDLLSAAEIAGAQARQFDQTPEPATYGMIGAGLLGVFLVKRRAA